MSFVRIGAFLESEEEEIIARQVKLARRYDKGTYCREEGENDKFPKAQN
jgi:hypothetical protein